MYIKIKIIVTIKNIYNENIEKNNIEKTLTSIVALGGFQNEAVSNTCLANSQNHMQTWLQDGIHTFGNHPVYGRVRASCSSLLCLQEHFASH